MLTHPDAIFNGALADHRETLKGVRRHGATTRREAGITSTRQGLTTRIARLRAAHS